ncbi:MAG TPA: STAS/SEC14 domain-containing protein [Ramlibacter sp.]|nr:STAS/SEC14 domain-containing protein [Ramlibacter sp.]
MNFDVVIARTARFIRVTVTGEPAIDELLSMIHLLGVESETWKDDRVLVDLRKVGTEFTRHEQFRIGEETAASLSHMEKIASVVPAERITRVSEKTAKRMGANLCVFDDEGAAIRWLGEL